MNNLTKSTKIFKAQNVYKVFKTNKFSTLSTGFSTFSFFEYPFFASFSLHNPITLVKNTRIKNDTKINNYRLTAPIAVVKI